MIIRAENLSFCPLIKEETMKKKFVFLVLFFLIISCTSKSKIEIVNSLRLEESDSLTIAKVSVVDISPDGKKMLITDGISGIISQYDLISGKIINFLKPPKSLVDSLAFSDWELPIGFQRNYVFVTREEFKKYRPEFNTDILFNNHFVKALYYNNSDIVVSAYLDAPFYCKETGYNKLTWTILFVYDKNLTYKKIINLHKIPASSQPQPFGICFNNNNLFIVTSNYNAGISNLFSDSLGLISHYDENFIFVKDVANMPERIMKYGFKYSITDNISTIVSDGTDTYFALNYLNYIGFLNKDKKIILKDYNYPTEINFENYNNYLKQNGINIKKSNWVEKVSNEEFIKYFPVSVENIFNVNQNIGVEAYKRNPINQEVSEVSIQLYNKKGDVLKQNNIDYINNNGILQYLTYNNNNNRLMLFRKDSEKGWTMEVAKWE